MRRQLMPATCALAFAVAHPRRVRFRVVVFRPFRDELLVGKVHKMTE